MITFYCTTPYWEPCDDALDYVTMSEEDFLRFIADNPNGLVKVAPTPYPCFFRESFIEKALDDNGYIREGVYKTSIKGVDFEYRIIENINIADHRRLCQEHSGLNRKVK